MAELFSNLGLVAQKQGDYDAARDLYEQGLTLSRELGYRWSIALLLNNLGLVAQERGDYGAASALHKESLTLRSELGERIGIAGSLAGLGGVVTGRESRDVEQVTHVGALREPPLHGQLERAARLFGMVDKLLEGTPAVLAAEDRKMYEQNLAAARALLNEEAFERAWVEGRGMSLEQAIAYALG